jgi:hypothetical protein
VGDNVADAGSPENPAGDVDAATDDEVDVVTRGRVDARRTVRTALRRERRCGAQASILR